jgi:hypothetical protein
VRTFEDLSLLPDLPVLTAGRYWPTVELWRDVEWTLVPRSTQIFTTHRSWADTDSTEVEDGQERLDCSARPQVLLIGCSYLAGDYLPKRRRLLTRLREQNADVHFTSVATSGAGLVTNLAHITRFLPAEYSPDVVVLAPTQALRQLIPQSPLPFNESPYGLWQNCYWLRALSSRRADRVLQDLIEQDLVRLEYLVTTIFPNARFLLLLFDASGTDEVSLLRPMEREAIEGSLGRFDRVHTLMERSEMQAFYRSLGPFNGNHPNPDQIDFLSRRITTHLSTLRPD